MSIKEETHNQANGLGEAAQNNALSTQPTPAQDIEKLKGEMFELRERLLLLRENEIFSLREKVASFSSQLKLGLAVIGIVGAVLTGFGIKQYSDLNELINKSMSKKVDESLGYYDQLTRALMLVNHNGCSSAIPMFKELSEKRTDDEIVFSNAIYCFNQREEYPQGYEFMTRYKNNGAFPKKFQFLLTFNTSGLLVFAMSLDDPSYEQEALDLLQRAERIGRVEESNDIVYPLYNLMLLYISRGELEKATVYADQIKALGGDKINWEDLTDRKWFKALETKQPKAREFLKNAFPPENVDAKTQSSISK